MADVRKEEVYRKIDYYFVVYSFSVFSAIFSLFPAKIIHLLKK